MGTLTSIRARISHPIPLAICCALLILFGVLSYSAVRTKSATYDEPMHALGAWVHLYEHDFRINFEDPPLWGYWAALPNGPHAITVNNASEEWTKMGENTNHQWVFTRDTLYRTPGNEGYGFLLHSRAMMVIAAMGLGALILVWGWQLGGPVAAVIATALFALDPNLIGHGALVKNDVPMALMMVAVFYCTWRIGQKLTWLNGLALAFIVAASLNVKFSALLFGPMLIVLLGLKVLLPGNWRVCRWDLSSRTRKFAASLTLLAVIGLISYVGIWTCYDFRFNVSPDASIKLNTALYKWQAVQGYYNSTHPAPVAEQLDPSVTLDTRYKDFVDATNNFDQAVAECKNTLEHAKLSDAVRAQLEGALLDDYQNQALAREIRNQAQQFLANSPPAEKRDATWSQNATNVYVTLFQNIYPLKLRVYNAHLRSYWASVGDEAPDRFIRFFNVLHDHRFLPSAWLHGVLFVHARSMFRGSYLMNDHSPKGWWYYFPMAMLFKTPVATMIALTIAGVIGILLVKNRRRDWKEFVWPLACLFVPFAIYMFSVMSANLNIGLRHVLCIYPFMYVAGAVLLARNLHKGNRKTVVVILMLGVMLTVETLSAWPNYIAYFNFAFNGEQGLNLLGDSNLDWGQDLPALAKWQKEHGDVPLALAYFGNPPNDPAYFDIKYDELNAGPIDAKLAQTHVLAISATRLQGVYPEGDGKFDFSAYRTLTPTAILDGTIYLYDLRPNP